MKNNRPWGTYQILFESDVCKVKYIIVKPGEQLSYQYHKHRDETWVIVEGEGEVIIDDIKKLVKYGDIITIIRLQKHRVKNIGDKDLIFIETQLGDSFEEEDIVRLKDNYGRK